MNKQFDYLYLFIDEAGDLNFSRTGTKYFTLTAVTRTRPFEWENQVASLKYDLIEFGLDIEYFHASEDRQSLFGIDSSVSYVILRQKYALMH